MTKEVMLFNFWHWPFLWYKEVHKLCCRPRIISKQHHSCCCLGPCVSYLFPFLQSVWKLFFDALGVLNDRFLAPRCCLYFTPLVGFHDTSLSIALQAILSQKEHLLAQLGSVVELFVCASITSSQLLAWVGYNEIARFHVYEVLWRCCGLITLLIAEAFFCDLVFCDPLVVERNSIGPSPSANMDFFCWSSVLHSPFLLDVLPISCGWWLYFFGALAIVCA